MLQPKRSKHRKMQKGRMKGDAKRGATIAFGSYALKALDQHWITDRQIEAARQALTREMKREGNVWIRIFPDKPITRKPAEVRMGKGKGSVDHWVYPAKSSRVLFEMSRRRFKLRKIYRLLSLSHLKLSSKIKFIYQRKFLRRETNFTISEPKGY